jgi:hypothetical protein
MKIEITMPKLYRNYMIVGEAIEAPRLRGWKLKGIIYSKSGKELKQMELKQSTFQDKKSAHYYALKGCRYWVDHYGVELERLLKVRL